MSASFSNALAGGISGSTFLFAPAAIARGALQPEDHDRGVTVNDAFTKRFGGDLRTYATIGSEYVTGYPVQFQNGAGRLPTHLECERRIRSRPRSRTRLDFGCRR